MIGRFPKNGMYYYKQGKLLYGLAALSKYSEPYTNYQRELNESKDKTLFNELNISDTSRKILNKAINLNYPELKKLFNLLHLFTHLIAKKELLILKGQPAYNRRWRKSRH